VTGIVPRVEMALAPDLTADPLSWTWTNITVPTRVQSLEIRRGASGGANEVSPGAMSFPVANPGGIHTPGRADSPYYPNLKRGMPVRAVVAGLRDPYLSLTGTAGASASTPDNAALDIVGDISIAVEFECPIRVPRNELEFFEVLAKWNVTGDQRSYRLLLRPEGALAFDVSTAGTNATKVTFSAQTAVPRADAGIITVGLYLDVDNGAGGKTIHWYVAPGKTITDLIASPATYETETTTTAGTTSIFSSSALLYIGDNAAEATAPPMAGKVRRAIVRSGTMSAGTIAANPIFTDQIVGATSFTDSAGRVWTVNSPATISDDQVRMLGELISAAPTWPAGPKEDAARIQWDVQGPLSRLRQGEKPVNSALYTKVMSLRVAGNVKAYWPFEDGAEAIQALSPMPGVPPMNIRLPGADMRFAADSTFPASKPLLHVNGQIGFVAGVPPYTPTATGQTRTDIFFRIDTPGAPGSGSFIGAISTSGTVGQWAWAIDDTNVYIEAKDPLGAVVLSTSFPSDPRFFGTWSLFSFNIEQSGGNIAWTLSIVPIPLGVSFGTSGTLAGTVGTVHALHNWNNPAPATGGMSFGHMIVTTGLGLGWLAPADSAFAGEPAGRRFYRLCQEQGIPALIDGPYASTSNWAAALAAGGKPMGPQRPGTLLLLLDECAQVEDARIGESRELRALTYRSDHSNQTPSLTLYNEVGHPFAPTHDTQQLVNDLTVSLPTGMSYRAFNQASINESDTYDDSRTVNAETQLQLPDLANWWLLKGTWPGMRVPLLRVELGRTPGLFDYWLATSIGDLIRAANPPKGFPERPLDVLLDGYVEELSRFHWAMSLNVSPAGPWQSGVRDDTGLGIRDTGGSVLNSSFAAGTATSMSVSTTLGPLWAVTAASNSALPFDVNVGGYQITVTAIGAAAGSVQTFTVSTVIANGMVAKTLAAGTSVSVWRPARRAF
jgi:hypothetical protein